MSEFQVNVFLVNQDGNTDSPSHKARLLLDPLTGVDYRRESVENNSPLKKVNLTRSTSGGFGISIKGGKEHNRPIVISKTEPRNEGICVGDRILSCNNQSLLNSTHREAVDAIKNQSDVCTVEVQSQVWESRPWPIKPPEIYHQFNGKFWMVRLARPKDKKFGDHAIEIASPDLTNRMIIQPESEAHANTFTSAFRRQMQKENDANLDSLNILLKNNAVFNNSDMHWKDLNQSLPNIELKKIDWFHETETHRHYVMALNNLELRLYNSLPTSWADWDHPAHILPLLGTSILLQKDTLVIRTGTRKEVEIRQFQGANLKAWLHAINEAKYRYVEKVEEALVEIVYKQETAFLGMHRLEGFKLYQITPDGKRPKEPTWTRHASTMSEIEDDQERTLILSFNDKSKFNFVLGDGLRPFIFLILNFIEAQAANSK